MRLVHFHTRAEEAVSVPRGERPRHRLPSWRPFRLGTKKGVTFSRLLFSASLSSQMASSTALLGGREIAGTYRFTAKAGIAGCHEFVGRTSTMDGCGWSQGSGNAAAWR